MFKNTNLRYTLSLTILLLFTILQAACECKNQYVGKGEVTEAMVEDIKKATEEYIKKHPELDTESKTKSNLLLEALTKLQKGQETDIPMEVVDAAVELAKPDVLQALIDIMTREVHDIQLEHELNARLIIAKMHAESDALMKKLDEDLHKTATKRAQQEEEEREKEEKLDQEKKKQEEEHLQGLIERRLFAEQVTPTISNTKIFVPSSRKGNLRRIKSHIQELGNDLTKTTAIQGLSQKQQEHIKYIVNRIEKERNEMKEILTAIHYTKAHPEAGQLFQQYKSEHLEIANKLLEDLKNYKEQLRKLLAERGKNLADYEDEPEIETEAEKIAYRELEELINDPSDTPKLVVSSNQEMQISLDRIGKNDAKRKVLEQEASQVATKVEEALELLKAKKRAIEKLYFNSDTKDYANRPINEGVQKIKMLQEAIDTLNKSVRHFCKQCIISLPHIPTIPVVTKKELQWAFKSLVDQLVPDSRLVKATLNSQPLPQTSEAWADLGLKSGFDFIPYGKELKLLAGPDKPVLQKKIKDLLVKLIEKQRLKAKTL